PGPRGGMSRTPCRSPRRHADRAGRACRYRGGRAGSVRRLWRVRCLRPRVRPAREWCLPARRPVSERLARPDRWGTSPPVPGASARLRSGACTHGRRTSVAPRRSREHSCPVSCRIPFSALHTARPGWAVCPGRCPRPRLATGSASVAGLPRQVVSFGCPRSFPPNDEVSSGGRAESLERTRNQDRGRRLLQRLVSRPHLAFAQENISICLPAGNSKVEGEHRPLTGRLMPNGKTSKVIQHLHRAVLLRDGAGLTDGQLLECFLTQRDDAAFAALVRRHGPMVWGVCRRILRNYHDAEDAFQATFLVLVRKAATVEPKEMVANWLYGVAYQTALKARSVAARRKERERQVVEMPEPAFEEQHVWHDLQPLLDQELSRLPDKYRVPIVLCDLEGKTRKEAAQHLGWPEGTVAGRLATARKMLARRLAQRGVVLSGGTLAAMLTHNAASACVPPSVLSSTIQAATALAAGQAAATGVISVKVAALTEGVLKSMLLTKLKTAVAVLLAVLVLGAGLGTAGLLYLARPAQGTPDGSEEKDAKKVGGAATADDKKGDRPALSGTWGKKDGELTIEFA